MSERYSVAQSWEGIGGVLSGKSLHPAIATDCSIISDSPDISTSCPLVEGKWWQEHKTGVMLSLSKCGTVSPFDRLRVTLISCLR